MADQPISGLATFPASPTSATGTSADLIEFLDVNDTSMASTGTNKKVNMADLFSTFVTAGSNITVTKQTSGGGVQIASSAAGLAVGNAVTGGSNNATLIEDGSGNLAALAIGSTGQILTTVSGAPAWAAPLTANYTSGIMSAASFNVPITTYTSVGNGTQLTLPAIGTYLIFGSLSYGMQLTGTVNQQIWLNYQLYNTTGSAVVANSFNNVQCVLAGTATSLTFAGGALIGPVIYTTSGTNQHIDLQVQYGKSVTTVVSMVLYGASNATTLLAAVRIA